LRTTINPGPTRRFWRIALLVVAQVVAGSACGQPSAGTAAAQLKSRQSPLSALPVIARIGVPAGPGWLGVGYGSVWLSKSQSKSVYRIDPVTNRVVATIPVGSDPELGVGFGLGFVWIADTKDHSLTQIDPKTNKAVRTIAVSLADEPEGSIGVGEGGIWILTNEGGTDSGTLSRVDPVSGRIVANIKVRPKSHAAEVAFRSVWVTSSTDNMVLRIDPRTSKVVTEIHVHPGPRFLAGGFGALWVLSQGDGTLARIDPGTNRVVSTIEVGVPGPGGDLAVGDGYVWVSAEGTPLTQIDPRTNEVVRQFVGGERLDTLRVGFASAWLADELGGLVLRASVQKPPAMPR
jgi:virginiamycin B lyase